MFLAPLLGLAAVGVQLRNPKVARIGCGRHGRMNRQTGPFEQVEVMATTRTENGTDDLPRRLCHHHLGLYGVPLLLVRVVSPLFFWGRCTGVSVASIRMTSIAGDSLVNAFFPGRAKAPDLTSVSSTQRMVS